MQADAGGSPRTFGDLIHGGPVGRPDLDDLADKLWFDREGGRDPYVRFGVLLFLSVVIASGGVLGDSTATVIGAMIVAPLMTPIMATALGVVTGDLRHLGRSLLTVAMGVAATVSLSYLIGVLSPVVVDATTNSQVAGRISPRLSDLMVALASGAAGAFALSRRNVSDTLPGVAIAISLVPPLCVVGIMLANHDASASAGAMLLFLTNFLAILVAGGGLLAIMGYAGVAFAGHHRGRRAAAVVVAVATVLIAVPLDRDRRARRTGHADRVRDPVEGRLGPGRHGGPARSGRRAGLDRRRDARGASRAGGDGGPHGGTANPRGEAGPHRAGVAAAERDRRDPRALTRSEPSRGRRRCARQGAKPKGGYRSVTSRNA